MWFDGGCGIFIFVELMVLLVVGVKIGFDVFGLFYWFVVVVVLMLLELGVDWLGLEDWNV